MSVTRARGKPARLEVRGHSAPSSQGGAGTGEVARIAVPWRRCYLQAVRVSHSRVPLALYMTRLQSSCILR